LRSPRRILLYDKSERIHSGLKGEMTYAVE